ncbi:MAG: hypothetical protein IJ740_00945 [Ruminococcus sp.]|nr:hypothetical protein [Ruminococcus sp.]
MKDTKRLEEMLSTLDAGELEELAADITLPKDRRSGRRIAERICGKETISMSKTIRKKTIAMIAAIAAVLGCTAAAGAIVYDHFTHQKENVTALYDDSSVAQQLESKGLLDNEQQTFDHYIISKDTKVMCDGGVALFAISVIPVDEQDQVVDDEVAPPVDLEVQAYDEDGTKLIIGGAEDFNYGGDYTGIMHQSDLLKYCESMPVRVKVKSRLSGNELGVLDYTFEKNVDTVQFKDENGRRVNLSEIALVCFDGVDVDWAFDPDAEDPGKAPVCTLIYKNGEQAEYNNGDMKSMCIQQEDRGEDYIFSNCCFSKLIDPQEVEAILVDGGRFEIVK